MLEIARVLRSRPLPVTVRFIGFPFEEIGLVGSRQVAQDLAAEGADVTGMVSLEMIGFSAPQPELPQPSDTLASLDLDFLTDATKATAAGLIAFGLLDADDDLTPDVCQGA